MFGDVLEDPARLRVAEAQAEQVGEVVNDALREAKDELS